MINDNALIEVEKIDPAIIFTQSGSDAILKEIKEKATDFSPDVSTSAGRQEIKSMAHKVSRSKTLIDGIGKARVAEWKKKAKVIDAGRKKIREALDVLKSQVRSPLTDWEEEEKRKEAEKIRQEQERAHRMVDEFSSVNLQVPFNVCLSMTDDEFEEQLRTATENYKSEQSRKEEENRRLRQEEERLSKEREEIQKMREEVMAAIHDERKKIELEKQSMEKPEAGDEKNDSDAIELTPVQEDLFALNSFLITMTELSLRNITLKTIEANTLYDDVRILLTKAVQKLDKGIGEISK